ncbi:MAG: BatD family protein, partial [Chthoniobacterales bacterium]
MNSLWRRMMLLGLALVACGAVSVARAEKAKVTAVLSDSETVVGQPVTLEIQVTGASNPKQPSQISVDGLEIMPAGTSRQYQMQNFSVSYSFSFNYTVMPTKAGTFKIPPLEVEAGSEKLRTPELTLNVSGGSGRSAGSQRGGGNSSNANVDPAQIGFVEMLLPKSVAYVGEVVPVQIRVGLNMRAPVESLQNGVTLAGQGFTTQKLTEPRQTIETINGRSYQMFIFKTAISAARTGKLEIGPAEITPVVRVPRRISPNQMMPRGNPFDDPFFNNFFNDPAFAPSVPREVHLQSQSATLEVKPLPPNPPAGFSGAVGSFTLEAQAKPTKGQIGDPITITTTLSGRGNFDRVNAPALENENGWHTYPPSSSFKQDDDVGISGTKTFESVVSAKEGKQKLPAMTFSYFDPVKERYTTLRSEEVPVEIAGGTAPTSSAVASSTATPSPTAAPAPKQPVDDILPQLDDRTAQRGSFTPLYQTREFWLAQLVPLIGLLGLAGVKWREARHNDREAQRVARLQQESADLQRKMRREETTPQEYMAQAARA